MFTGKYLWSKNVSLSVSAPSSQRTIEDIDTDQSLIDGNSSSDDPLKSTAKRFVVTTFYKSRPMTEAVFVFLELYHPEPEDPTEPFTFLVLNVVKQLRHLRPPAITNHRNLITESLTNPSQSRLTRITQRLTQKTQIHPNCQLIHPSWTLL